MEFKVALGWIYRHYAFKIIVLLFVLFIIKTNYRSIRFDQQTLSFLSPSDQNSENKAVENKNIDELKPSLTSTSTSTSTSTTTTTSSKEDEKPHVKIFDLRSELKPADIYSGIQCRKSLNIFVDTTLCVHDLKKDIHVSGSIMANGIWEREIVCNYSIIYPFLS